MKTVQILLLVAVLAFVLADDRRCPRDIYDKIQEAKKKGLISWESIPPADTMEHTLEHDHLAQTIRSKLPFVTKEMYEPVSDFKFSAEELPENFLTIDKWSNASYHVFDQGQCGSCWSFSVTTTMGDRFNIVNGPDSKLILSAQRPVSCFKGFLTDGCNGGVPELAMEDIADDYLVETSCQKYTSGTTGENGVCHDKCDDGSAPAKKYSAKNVASLATYTDMKKELYSNGSVSVGFQVPQTIMCYASGIYKQLEDDQILGGHAVVAVGYGKDAQSGEEYVVIRNSWGNKWGTSIHGEVTENDGGYFYMALSTAEETGLTTSGVVATPMMK